MTREELESVQNSIDYQFKNLDLLQQAFVRSSYSAEYGGGDNEVLEFIGDKVLDLYVVKHLVQLYGGFCHDCDEFDDEEEPDEFISEYSEGELTEMKTQLVQRKMLAHRIDLLGFSKYLILGNGDVKNKVYKQDSVKEDLFEAIVGAVALDSDWNMEILEHVLNNMLEPDAELENDDDCENYIALIQEWALDYDGELPRYHVERYPSGGFYSVISVNQYIQARDNIMTYGKDNYQCLLYLNGLDKPVMAYGHSEKEARMNAAETAYNYIEENDLLYSIRDEIENPNREESINQLETLARRGYFSIPTYDFDQNYDNDGNPIWKCDCHIVEYKKVTHGKASAKKEAKKTAAYKMLKFVLENE